MIKRLRELAGGIEKHVMLTTGKERYVYGAEFKALLLNPALEKRTEYTGYIRDQEHKIGRYWFAMPLELAIKLRADIPEHAGLIGVERRQVSVLKDAPRLKHSRKLTDAERLQLMRLAYIRFWTVEEKEDVS